MKLLVDIDDRLFREVQKLTKAKTKKDTIVIPMKEYVRQRRRADLAEMIGTFDIGLSLKGLRDSRKRWKKS